MNKSNKKPKIASQNKRNCPREWASVLLLFKYLSVYLPITSRGRGPLVGNRLNETTWKTLQTFTQYTHTHTLSQLGGHSVSVFSSTALSLSSLSERRPLLSQKEEKSAHYKSNQMGIHKVRRKNRTEKKGSSSSVALAKERPTHSAPLC